MIRARLHAAIIALAILAGCAQPSIYRDPATGQVQQCTSTIPPTLPVLAQSEIDRCGKTLESMGWKKQ